MEKLMEKATDKKFGLRPKAGNRRQQKPSTWKLLLVGAAALSLGGGVLAQAAARFEPRAQVAMMVERAQKDWNLSATQKAKIKTILQDAVPRGIAIHDDMKIAPEVRRAQLNQLQFQTQSRINALLTATQREKASHWRQNVRANATQILARMALELKLTPDQQSKIRPIISRRLAQAQSLRGDMSLTVAQKIVRLQEIRKNSRAEMNGVLTKQQGAQLDKMTEGMLAEARHQFALWRNSNSG